MQVTAKARMQLPQQQGLLSLCMLLLVLLVGQPSAQAKMLATVERVELDRYLGVWHELARKPMHVQRRCQRAVTATYTLNEYGNIQVHNRCEMKNGQILNLYGEGFVQNPPSNSRIQMSFLPESVRWLTLGRAEYWILKLDQNYQTVLVGEPGMKYMWIMSKDPQLSKRVLKGYLDYATALGYDLSDVIYTK